LKLRWPTGEAGALSARRGARGGPTARALPADEAARATSRCERLAALFGARLYVELQRHNVDRERRIEAGLIDLAYAKGLPLVATNEPYFASTDDYEAHDALLCIAGGRLGAETARGAPTNDPPIQAGGGEGGACVRTPG